MFPIKGEDIWNFENILRRLNASLIKNTITEKPPVDAKPLQNSIWTSSTNKFVLTVQLQNFWKNQELL